MKKYKKKYSLSKVFTYSLLIIFFFLILIELSLQVFSLHLKKPGLILNDWKYFPYVDFITQFDETKNYYNKAPEIWLFGGSTLRRDQQQYGSIPDKLSEILYKNKKKYTLTNAGQYWYIFNQERILFFELLRNSPPPKIVIFYNGANDTTIGGMYPYSYEYNKKILHKDYKRSVFLKKLSFFRGPGLRLVYLFSQLDKLRSKDDPVQDNIKQKIGLIKNKHSTHNLLKNYKFNMKIIQSICITYDIKCYFIWQPLSYRSYDPSPNNKIYSTAIKNDKYLQRQTNFLYLGDIFKGEQEKYYFEDPVHLEQSKEGNSIVANKIYEFIFTQDLQ
jgi:hypothetical protein